MANYDLGKSIDSFENTGGAYTEAGKAYVSAIVGNEEFTTTTGVTYLNIFVVPEGIAPGKRKDGTPIYDKIQLKKGDNFTKTLGNLANNIIKSNPQLASKGGGTTVNPDNWTGLNIGVVYGPQKSKESNWTEWSLFLAPVYGISTLDVDAYEPVGRLKEDCDSYIDWKADRASAKANDTFGNAADASAAKANATPVAPVVEDNLPF